MSWKHEKSVGIRPCLPRRETADGPSDACASITGRGFLPLPVAVLVQDRRGNACPHIDRLRELSWKLTRSRKKHHERTSTQRMP